MGNDFIIKCPVCGKGLIEEWFDVCEVCGWEYDNLQYVKPDFKGGANKMSLNQAREAYKNGEKIE
jgi:hypothetical protein